MLNGIGQLFICNFCSSKAINARLQPLLDKGRDDPRGRKRNFRLERFTALDGSLSEWGEPCGIRLFVNSGTRGVMRTASSRHLKYAFAGDARQVQRNKPISKTSGRAALFYMSGSLL